MVFLLAYLPPLFFFPALFSRSLIRISFTKQTSALVMALSSQKPASTAHAASRGARASRSSLRGSHRVRLLFVVITVVCVLCVVVFCVWWD